MLSVSSACRADDAWQALRHAANLHQPSSPLSSSSSTSASSEASVFSVDAASQSSESSVGSIHVSYPTEDSWSRRQAPDSRFTKLIQQQQAQPLAIPAQERQHPRRCSISQGPRVPPSLTRGTEKKGQFVDNLVDSAANMVEIIWPTATPACFRDTAMQHGPHLSLRTFIQETLRRSRTSFSTLQVALYYLLLIKAFVPKYDFTMEQPVDAQSVRALQCGRRMFLAALILASKYLQDRNYSARAWSKISGLQVNEINTNEMAFLQAIDWKLHIPESTFDRWQNILIQFTAPSLAGVWKEIVLKLAPSLDNLPPLVKPCVDQMDVSRAPLARRWLTYSMPTPSMENVSSPVGCSPPSPSRTGPPAVLEPMPTIPTPPRHLPLAALPTPNFTPTSSVCSTPATGLANFGQKSNAMCSAMSMAQNASMARTVMDCASNAASRPSFINSLEGYRLGQRRPSVQYSSDLASVSDPGSPGSMISDHSQFSRSSSISSASSSQTSPTRSRDLARLAAFNAQKLPEADAESVVILSSEPLTRSPEMDVHMSSGMTVEPADMHTPPQGKKRCRSITSTNMPMDLQAHVRGLLTQPKFRSFVPQPSQLSAMANGLPTARYPVPVGWKRACCPGGDAIQMPLQPAQDVLRPTGGPGMWKGLI